MDWVAFSSLVVAGAAAACFGSGIQYSLKDLGTLGGKESWANMMNSRGEIVGWANTADGSMRAFLYARGVMKDLGTLGGRVSEANDIDASGKVGGGAETAGGAYHAFLYSAGKMRDLGTLGGRNSVAMGFGLKGEVGGWADTAKGSSHACAWSNGKMRDDGDLGYENWKYWGESYSSSQSVTSTAFATNLSHGELSSGGKAYDLNDLLDSSGADWKVQVAKCITADGHIAANAVNRKTGLHHAVLLTPAAGTPARPKP